MKTPTYLEVCNAIKKGTFTQWPKKVQEESLLTPGPYLSKGWTPLHEAAEHGLLHQIPRRLLTEQALLTRDEAGWTPLHLMAESNSRLFYKELLNKENILTPNNAGFTVLHAAAHSRGVDQIPQALLTEESLLTKDDEGWTPLHYAARDNWLESLPIKLSEKTFREILTWRQTSFRSREWVEKQLKKEELRRSLQKTNHPEL
jgi:hypothetical protein